MQVQHPCVRCPPHPQRPRRVPGRESSRRVGFTALRASRASSAGATFGARRAHSASASSSANFVTALNCSALNAPSYAAAAISGSDSSAPRGLDRVTHRTAPTRPDRPSVGSIRPRSSSTRRIASSSISNRRFARTTSTRRAPTDPSTNTATRRGDRRCRTCTDQNTGVRHSSPGVDRPLSRIRPVQPPWRRRAASCRWCRDVRWRRERRPRLRAGTVDR